MGIQYVVPVNSVADLRVVDSRVRTLCNTSSGAQCQAMLTTEYQSWRRKVAQCLTTHCLQEHTPLSQNVHEAYMQGFRVRFCSPVCIIAQSLPSFVADVDNTRKRKADGELDVF